jgi:hypothetical protein
VQETEAEIPALLHFIFRSIPLNQFITSVFAPPFITKQSRKLLFRRYQHIHARLWRSSGPLTTYFEAASTFVAMGWHRSGEFDMFAMFSPLVSKENAVAALNRTLRWIRKEEENLFLLNPPFF